jgi:sugar-specific transcriptional regulator TrmB
MPSIDLTPFGFTPTESRVYEVLLSGGPGTGYAVARNAGLARANAYSALEGLVVKGAARAAEDQQPKVFRAEPPATVLARIANAQGESLESLSQALEGFGAPATPSIVEISSPKGLLQLLTHEIGRARESVRLIAPAEAYPILGPALRRAVSAGLEVILCAQAQVQLPFALVEAIPGGHLWPGIPLVALVDQRSALIAARNGVTFDRLRTLP